MSDGLALLFWAGVAGLVILVAAGAVESFFSLPDRRWLKRLRSIERGRAAQRQS